MRVRRQAAPPLPARKEGVHEYRASLMSVALATAPRRDAFALMEPAIRPVPLEEAVELIKGLPPTYRVNAEDQAAVSLAAAAHIDRRTEFKIPLATLVGETRFQQIEASLKKGISGNRLPTLGQIQEAISKHSSSGNMATSTPPDVTSGPQPLRADEPPDGIPMPGKPPVPKPPGKPPPPPVPPSNPLVLLNSTSRLDLRTLATTVDISSTTNLDFGELTRRLDPQNWKESPFWLESARVRLDKENGRFVKEPPPTSAATPGWEGFFFEHVEWNWNLSTVSSFRNYLRINYIVNPATKMLQLTFSLYSCDSSQIFALVNRGGVDIDWGFQQLSPFSVEGTKGHSLKTQKNIRFADLLERRTPYEGAPGRGQILSYLAPAIVGLWMNDLLKNLHSPAPLKGGHE